MSKVILGHIMQFMFSLSFFWLKNTYLITTLPFVLVSMYQKYIKVVHQNKCSQNKSFNLIWKDPWFYPCKITFKSYSLRDVIAGDVMADVRVDRRGK